MNLGNKRLLFKNLFYIFTLSAAVEFEASILSI